MIRVPFARKDLNTIRAYAGFHVDTCFMLIVGMPTSPMLTADACHKHHAEGQAHWLPTGVT